MNTETICWIPVGESVPEADVLVLTYSPDEIDKTRTAYFASPGKCRARQIWVTPGGYRLDGVTHWARMPEGPKP